MNVVIIDDDQLVALSLQTILEACDDIQVSATGGSGADAIRLYEEYHPDVLLMDIRMENINGLEASETIMASHPDARILLLTTFSDDEYIIKALSIGAKGYILKQNFESIAPAVKAVYNGQTVYAVTSYLTTDLTPKATESPATGFNTKFTDCNDTVTPKEEVNLRNKPSVTDADSVVVATAKKGEFFTRTGYNTEVGWSRVVYNGQTLYCVTSLLSIQ